MKPDVYLLSTKIDNAMAASNPPLSNQSLFIYLFRFYLSAVVAVGSDDTIKQKVHLISFF